MASLMDNYKNRNTHSDASQKDWCIAPVLGKTQQVTLELNNGSCYEYACRYAVAEGAVAIVGRKLPQYSFMGDTETSPNTGCMGQVTAVLPKLTIKKQHAVEIDYVFIEKPQKKNLTQCVKFLSSGSESYDKTLLMDKGIVPIRPITYHIQKILSAASVLAHPALVTPEQINLAKATILENKSIQKDMLDVYWGPPEQVSISIAEIHIPDHTAEDTFEEIRKELDNHKSWHANEGMLDYSSGILDKFASSKTVNDYVNLYSHLGAISIMVRGGFKNLLAAYLSAEPPIEACLTDALEILDGLGNQDTYALLKELK